MRFTRRRLPGQFAAHVASPPPPLAAALWLLLLGLVSHFAAADVNEGVKFARSTLSGAWDWPCLPPAHCCCHTRPPVVPRRHAAAACCPPLSASKPPVTQVTCVPERLATATLSCHPACRSCHAAAAAVAARNWRNAHKGTASRYPGAGRPRRLGSRRFRTPMPLAPRAVRFRGPNHSCVGGRARFVAGGGRRGVACESRWHRRHFASAVQPHSSSALVHWDCLNHSRNPAPP